MYVRGGRNEGGATERKGGKRSEEKRKREAEMDS